MTDIAAKYYVRLLDQSSVQTDIFDRFTRININQKLNGVGSYTASFEGLTNERINRFKLDGQLEFYRTVPGNELPWYVEFAGFHRVEQEEIKKDKKKIFSSIGVGYNSLLERTNIAYREGTIRADKYDVGETIMKEYVEENCGELATIKNGRIVDGVFPNFSTQSDGERGSEWSGSRAFENLLDTLQGISEYTGVDFDVSRSGYPGFIFQTYNLLKGADRTIVGLDSATGENAAGNKPVTLSVNLGNLQNATYKKDRLDEANVCIVLGDGEGATRSVLYRKNDAAAQDSPYNRVEVARPSQVASIPGLSDAAAAELKTFSMQQTGDEVLNELQAKEDFTFKPMQQPSTLYGKHYFLGDRVTLQFRDFTVHKRIVGVQIRVERDRENISLDVSSFATGTQ